MAYGIRQDPTLPLIGYLQTTPGIEGRLTSSSPHDESLPRSPTEEEQETAARAQEQGGQPEADPVQAEEEKGKKQDVQTTYPDRPGKDFFSLSKDAIRGRLAPRSPGSSVSSAALAVGARVEIHSLLAAARAPELNGVHGEIVVPLDSSTERWGVKTDTDSRVWSLRPDNLRRLEEHVHVSPASPGLMRIACTAYAARSPDELR
jgi:hypothetical protein